MIILEMEETLVEVRAIGGPLDRRHQGDAARVSRLDELQADWTAKAELALSKDREDLAKAALIERQKAADMADGLRDEMNQIEQVLRGYEADIAKLQAQAARSPRPAECDRGAVRKRGHPGQGARDHARQPHRGRVRQVRAARAPRRLRRRPRRGAWASAASKTKFTSCKAAEAVDRELEAMKAALKARGRSEGREDGQWPASLSVFARPQGREDRRRLLDARRDDRDRPDLRPHRLRRAPRSSSASS